MRDAHARRPPRSVAASGRDVFSDAQFGWGEATGIEIEQMAETSVACPARRPCRASAWATAVRPRGHRKSSRGPSGAWRVPSSGAQRGLQTVLRSRGALWTGRAGDGLMADGGERAGLGQRVERGARARRRLAGGLPEARSGAVGGCEAGG